MKNSNTASSRIKSLRLIVKLRKKIITDIRLSF